MKVSKAKRKIRMSVEEVKSEFEEIIDHHVAKMNRPGPPMDPTTVILGTLPHLVVVAFTVFIVWTARPGSSESACVDLFMLISSVCVTAVPRISCLGTCTYICIPVCSYMLG